MNFRKPGHKLGRFDPNGEFNIEEQHLEQPSHIGVTERK